MTSGPPLVYDFDNNGKLDPMVFCYLPSEDGSRKPFPMHTKDDLSSQLVSIRKKYPTYKSFGRASINELWSKQDRENAITMQANHLATSYIENKGNGQFTLKALPVEAQVAPVYGMMSKDVDDDGFLDLLLVGNDYGIEPGSGRHDAFSGLCLKGDGKGNFTAMTIAKSGFFINGDAKGLANIHTATNDELLIATQNQDSLLVFNKKINPKKESSKLINLNADDFCVDVFYDDNRRQRFEFYYGSTFLSQSSRKFYIAKNPVKVIVTDFKGNKRELLK